MYSTAYNLWTFTWFVHFELPFRLKETEKIHTEGLPEFHSNIYFILFGSNVLNLSSPKEWTVTWLIWRHIRISLSINKEPCPESSLGKVLENLRFEQRKIFSSRKKFEPPFNRRLKFKLAVGTVHRKLWNMKTTFRLKIWL